MTFVGSLGKGAFIVVLLAIGIVCLKKYMNGCECDSKVRLDGKVVVITGANTGIGKETAKDMAIRGARVYMACRSIERGEASASDIKNTTGVSKERLVVMKLNLASLQSVRDFVQEFKKREPMLHILINNAGVMWTLKNTQDGFEETFGVNHLGHFLLTHLLIDSLKAGAPSRIVTVSSIAHRWTSMDYDDIMTENRPSWPTVFKALHAYCQSKLANVLFSAELGRQLNGTGISTYSLHPGTIWTELNRNSVFYAIPGLPRVIDTLAWPILKTVWHGAQTQIYCAVEESIANDTGKYYSDCAEMAPSAAGSDAASAKRLWELSEKLLGLKK